MERRSARDGVDCSEEEGNIMGRRGKPKWLEETVTEKRIETEKSSIWR